MNFEQITYSFKQGTLKVSPLICERSTGFTPNMLMLGRETNQPADLMFGEGQEKIYSGNDEYVMGLENAIKNAHEVARKTLICRYMVLIFPTQFRVLSMVD
jgi:hypothetical protein